jgi:hypothetical protein
MLYPGQVAVRTKLTAHKGERVEEPIKERGCERLYLPLYFSRTSTPSRRLSPRSRASYGKPRLAAVKHSDRSDLGQVISAVTARDACGFFEHCGYTTPVQSL